MAFELSMDGRKEETLNLLSIIEDRCINNAVLTKVWETKANLYERTEQFDSVLYANDILLSYGYNNPTGDALKAGALWHLGKTDSSLTYAKKVLYSPWSSEQDKYNMLYILIHADTALSEEDKIKIAEQRSDIETDILIPLHNQWAMSVQLLEQDLTRTPDLRWLYSIIITLTFVGTCISVYVYEKRKKRELLTQQVDKLKEKHNELTENYIANYQQIENEINHQCQLLRRHKNLTKELEWNNYNAMCNIVDKQFYLFVSKIRGKQVLNETEVRLCVLVLLELSRAEIAATLPYSLNSVGKLKDQTAKKLGTTGKNMRNFLLKTAIKG